MPRNEPVRRAGEIFVCCYRANIRRLPSPEVGRAGIEKCNNFFLRREERSVSEMRKRRNIFRALDAGEFFVELDGHVIRWSVADVFDRDEKQAVIENKIHDDLGVPLASRHQNRHVGLC